MNCEPIEIRSVIRRMRGGSQAQLIEAADGRHYVVKFVGNPQGTRTLINEWIAYTALHRLGVSTPPLRILRLTDAVIAKTANLDFHAGSRQSPIEAGFHLGSLCPVNPEQIAIFDFLPEKLIGHIVNLTDFAKALVIDKLLGQIDQRQAVFTRERSLGGLFRFAHT